MDVCQELTVFWRKTEKQIGDLHRAWHACSGGWGSVLGPCVGGTPARSLGCCSWILDPPLKPAR